MSNKEKILEMLRDKELTVKNIAQELDLKENAVNVYIGRLKNEKKIKKVGKIERYNIYKAIQKGDNVQILKNGILELNKLMSVLKPKIPSNIDVNKIREGIELCHTI